MNHFAKSPIEFPLKHSNLRDFLDTSTSVSEELLKYIRRSQGQTILSINCGHEDLNKLILNNMHFDSILIVFERKSTVCKRIKKTEDDRLFVFNDSVWEINRIFQNREIADMIISADPLFPTLAQKIAQTMEVGKAVLKPHGVYIQIAYVDIYKSVFRRTFKHCYFKRIDNFPISTVYVGFND